MENGEKIFRVEGFGEVGYANLYAFVPFDGFKLPCNLEVNESTEGKLRSPMSDNKPERLTRVR
jgi:hypothetical protein